jgi:hypothetical protein
MPEFKRSIVFLAHFFNQVEDMCAVMHPVMGANLSIAKEIPQCSRMAVRAEWPQFGDRVDSIFLADAGQFMKMVTCQSPVDNGWDRGFVGGRFGASLDRLRVAVVFASEYEHLYCWTQERLD